MDKQITELQFIHGTAVAHINGLYDENIIRNR